MRRGLRVRGIGYSKSPAVARRPGFLSHRGQGSVANAAGVTPREASYHTDGSLSSVEGPRPRGGDARVAARGPCAPCGFPGGPHGGPRPRQPPPLASPASRWDGAALLPPRAVSERQVEQDGFGDFAHAVGDHARDVVPVLEHPRLDQIAYFRVGHGRDDVEDGFFDDLIEVFH